MIRLLLALHPRRWRARYGEELLDLVQAQPLSVAVVVDLARNAARQHARLHAAAWRVVTAVAVSVVVETAAVRAGISDNILWPPTTPARALALAALLLTWLTVAPDAVRTLRGRPRPRTSMR